MALRKIPTGFRHAAQVLGGKLLNLPVQTKGLVSKQSMGPGTLATWCRGDLDLALDEARGHSRSFDLKRLVLFILVSGVAGLAAVLGSALGAANSHAVLFVGALLGGLVGICIAALLATKLRLTTTAEIRACIFGGSVGFLIAAAIAVANAHTPMVPILGVSLVGGGTLIALTIHRRRESNRKL